MSHIKLHIVNNDGQEQVLALFPIKNMVVFDKKLPEQPYVYIYYAGDIAGGGYNVAESFEQITEYIQANS